MMGNCKVDRVDKINGIWLVCRECGGSSGPGCRLLDGGGVCCDISGNTLWWCNNCGAEWNGVLPVLGEIEVI